MTDLAANSAGSGAQAARDALNRRAPVSFFIFRLLNIKTDERNWRLGAIGERKVGRQLDRLKGDWRAIHSVPVGDRGADIDHLVIGPPGVITLNTKHHPGGRVKVSPSGITVNGTQRPYLEKSRHEAERASRLLSTAIGHRVEVRPAVVFVGLDDIRISSQPARVHITTRRRLRRWLESLPPALSATEIDQLFQIARRSEIWTGRG